MTRIVVLFNLKDADSKADYESWAKSTDLPVVNGLTSVDNFSVHRAIGMLGSDAAPPYQYVEIIDINDMELFGNEVGTETMRKVAGEFQGFADSPLFILTDAL